MSRLLCLLLWMAGVCRADLTGHWEATVASGGREYPLHIELRHSGRTLTGAFGQTDDFLWELSAAAIDGDRLTFVLKMPGGPEAAFAGTVKNNAAVGQLTSAVPGLGGSVSMKKVGPPLRLPSQSAPQSAGDLAGLTDDFSRPETLANWRTLSAAEDLPDRIDSAQIAKQEPGFLTIVPKSGAWWAGYHGVFLFKAVEGDFAVTARLKVSGKEGAEPANIWTLSGLLVRAPCDRSLPLENRRENWIYLMTGRGPAKGRVVDAKSTRNSINAWDITPAQPGWYELRIVRMGSLFLLFCRPDGASWSMRKLILREDLPPTLQVGINVTSDFTLSASMPAAKYNAALFEGKSKADATVLVDWVRFSAAPDRAKFAPLAGRPLLDVSPAELLRAVE